MIFAGLEYKLYLIHQPTCIAHIILLDFYDCGQGIRNVIDFEQTKVFLYMFLVNFVLIT
jgi:hypothetical protein